MLHLLQPNQWSCLPTAFAMVLKCEPKDIFDYLGHDGSQIVWPHLPDPMRRRSFHIQEMIDYCLSVKVLPVELEPLPWMCPVQGAEPHDIVLRTPFEEHLRTKEGVLLGMYRQQRHSVAWNTVEILDPTGYRYPIDEFEIQGFFPLFAESNLT